jgi:hypothetical protein
MDAVFDLATTQQGPFTVKGDASPFIPEGGVAFVAACRREGRPILGIEGYHDATTGPALLPEPLADFSSLRSLPHEGYVRPTCDEALHLIRTAVPAQTSCEFVLG